MSSSVIEKVNGHTVAAEPRFDPVALAEADAIRTRADAEADALRVEAEGKAKASEIKAVEEARKQKIANDKAEARAAEEQAARDARIAESNRKRREAERAEKDAEKQTAADEQTAAEAAKVVDKADKKWRGWAIGFYTLCAAVALPVQISAFWNPDKPWMAGAPVLLEVAALVVAFGTAAAVANKRPHWHFRLITWVLASIAASVNLWHGSQEFDAATAIATALASIFGPGVWDLHEHGRIRKRDGALSRRERRALKKAAEAEAAEKAAAEKHEAERQAYREKAARDAAETLDALRAEEFPEVYRHAKRLAADLGERTITESIWKRAKLDVDGALPGESAEILRMRNVAERRVAAARENTSVSTLSKTTNAQRANQMPRTQRGPARKPPVRRRGDTPKYVAAARKQAAITARITAAEEQK
ncbi:hypothetical protein [Streptomyces sp. PA03-2a]|uniref:hypothetical protein n=1 Tax=Streptomyces sp. PA03-2a TaxID=3028701 RepID=UPI0029B97CB3|nr:hypothetical protein [Streptomyces sp. PA03-2a]MDX2732860.1 hypothetical protein [Streptomyces sp. PA03-2a]